MTQAEHDFIAALDKFADLAAEVRVQQTRQYNGLSNHAAQTEMDYSAARQALIAAHLKTLDLEVR